MEKHKIKVLGITGGIGSGKSETLAYLNKKPKIAVYDLDKLAHDLQKPGELGYLSLLEYFGKGILENGGEISRENLGAIVFHDTEKLHKLNQILHPLLKTKVEVLISENSKISLGAMVIEGALLHEAGFTDLCDQIWQLYVPCELRKTRVVESRGYSEEKFYTIVEKQSQAETLAKGSYRTIDNSGSKLELEEKIEKALKEFM